MMIKNDAAVTLKKALRDTKDCEAGNGDVRARLGAEIRLLRQERQMTVRELADVSGVGYTHISRIENGKYNVRLDTLELLGNALGVTLTFKNSNTRENEVCIAEE